MLKIAVISDDTGFLDRTKPLLTKEGYEVNLYPLTKDDLTESLIDAKIGLIIMDYFSAPKASGKTVKDMKADDALSGIHCIAVLAESPGGDFDFKAGIDDFVFKDRLDREIGLKIGLFQWKHSKIDSKDKIVVSEFVIDNANYEVIFKGEKVDLTYKEFELLKFLIVHRGRVYSRDALLNQVWGYNYYGGTRTVDVHVRRLRAKIGLGIDNYLKTVRNVGYKFEG
jgi:DNA-binding response OmpR family regulator